MTQQKRIGRPKLPAKKRKVRVTVTLSRIVYDHLCAISGGSNLSKAVDDSIRLTMPQHIEQAPLTTVDTSS